MNIQLEKELSERIRDNNRYPVNRTPATSHENRTEPVHTQDRHLPETNRNTTASQTNPIDSEFTSMLWHELLSPVTLIKGYTSTLLQLGHAITKEERQQYIAGIDSANNRMFRLIDSLRDVTHLEETVVVRGQKISLVELIQKIMSELQGQTNKHNVRFHTHEPVPHVRVDPERIEQVIVNLITNAIKYSPDGGEIDIDIQIARTEEELNRISEGAPRQEVPCYVVSVADEGVGIPEEDLNQIFKKFYRSKNKSLRGVPGTGLGLYICKLIVESHKGHIWANNRVDGGSIFNFSLPVLYSNTKTQ